MKLKKKCILLTNKWIEIFNLIEFYFEHVLECVYANTI